MVDRDVHCLCEYDGEGALLSECNEHRTLRNDLKAALLKLSTAESAAAELRIQVKKLGDSYAESVRRLDMLDTIHRNSFRGEPDAK